MEWIQFLILIATLAALFLWNRAESRNDMRAMNEQVTAINGRMDASKAETMALVTAIHETIRGIDKEIKDFHGRLCAIEERNRSREK